MSLLKSRVIKSLLVSGFVGGCLVPSMHIVSSAEAADSLCKGESVVYLNVNRVQLLAPPEMTKQSEFWMGPPTEIRFHDGTEANPTYGLITQDGQIFSSTRS